MQFKWLVTLQQLVFHVFQGMPLWSSMCLQGEGLAVWQQLQHLYSKHRPEAKVSGRTAKSSGLTGPRSKPNGWGSRRVY